MDVLADLELHLRAHYPFVYLLTWEEGRALDGLRAVAKTLERPMWRWTIVDGVTGDDGPVPGTRLPTDMLDWVSRLEVPGIVVLQDFHPYVSQPEVVRRMRDVAPILSHNDRALVLVSPSATVPRELEKDVVLLELPLPGLKEVARLFHGLVRSEKVDIDLPLFERFVKAPLGLTQEEIRRVYAKVLLRHHAFGEAQLADVVEEKSQIIRRTRFLEFVSLTVRMDELGGLENLKGWLSARTAAFTEKARKYGLPQPKGLFLVGVQGCGKSLTAKAVADLWKVPLLRMDVASLMHAAGEAEEGLRQAIAIAESMAPAVLWVDEIEKAFAGVESGSASTAGATRVFGNFVTWLQEKSAPVFVIATANDVRHLPPELLRKGRFDEIFFVDLPNIHERELIFRIHVGKRGRDASHFDTWRFAEMSEKFSGAEIEQIVIDAMFTAFAHEREMETEDVVRAIRDTVPLARTMDERIKALKEWARDRTRPATYDTRRIDFFEDWADATP
jgi:ATP-dependent 26S proteasome regulatory subunit